MSDPRTAIERFRSFLEAKGKQLTRSRATVVEVLLSFGPRIDVKTRMAWLCYVFSDISRSTVYRTLSDMEEAGLVQRLSGGEF